MREGPVRILLVGATGLLGQELAQKLIVGGFEVISHGYSSPADVRADLTDRSAAQRLLDQVVPGLVVNLAALTDVDRCEREPQQAFLLNVRLPENLAAWVRDKPGSHLLHLSTDQVYDGPGPHGEEDVTLLNYYAFSKYAGELAALSCGATVLRTNFFGPARARASFSDWLNAGLAAGRPVQLVKDVLFSPLHLETLCDILSHVAAKPAQGLFNLGSRDGMSKCDFGLALARVLGHDAGQIEPVHMSQLNLQAPRPHDMRMDVSRFESTYHVTMPTLEHEIQRLVLR